MKTIKKLAMLCITLTALTLSSCKKDDPKPVEPPIVEDETTVNVRGFASQRSGIVEVKDAKLVPVTVTYADYTYKDENGKNVTITGKGRFTLEKSRALATLIPVLVSLNESTSPVTIQFWNEYETFRGGLYRIGLLMSSSPPPSGDPNYALIDVSEIVWEPTGGQSFLTKYAFIVPKKSASGGRLAAPIASGIPNGDWKLSVTNRELPTSVKLLYGLPVRVLDSKQLQK